MVEGRIEVIKQVYLTEMRERIVLIDGLREPPLVPKKDEFEIENFPLLKLMDKLCNKLIRLVLFVLAITLLWSRPNGYKCRKCQTTVDHHPMNPGRLR